MRLVNSNTTEGSQYEGRVEVRHNGQWGTVCAHDWSLEDAQVVCRMAGFATAVRQDTTGYYGAGAGQVWLDHVRCSGQEATLDDCTHNSWGVVDASCSDHSMDAGVVCSDGEQPPLQDSISPSVSPAASPSVPPSRYLQSWLCDWSMETSPAKDVWRSFTAISGVPSAMTALALRRLWWCADSWATTRHCALNRECGGVGVWKGGGSECGGVEEWECG